MSIRTSEEIDVLSAALTAAQSKFGAALKDSDNPFFKSKYADLSSVIQATLAHLNAEGIACMQHPQLTYSGEGDTREALVTVTTRLQHKSGQWMESDLSVPARLRNNFDAQSVGSGVTYACRYALQSICCVPREDDDGNAATGNTGSKEAAQAVAKEKISQAAKAGNKTAIKAQEAQEKASSAKVSTLFYSYPSNHNGHFAEWLNIPAYIWGNQDKEDDLRLVFSAHGAKKAKDGSVLVPQERMEALLTVLAGDYGVAIEELKPR
jgi:hypothetical protein